MPRVVPSDVVKLIDKVFPWAAQATAAGQSVTQLGIQHAGGVAAVADVTERIPPELLVLAGDKYASMIAGLAACRAALQAWGTGDRHTYLSAVPGFDNVNAVGLVRQALAQCPDQAASATTQELSFINDPDLRASIRLDLSGANGDLAQGEWKGATVLAGSATEALLLWVLQQREKQKPGTLSTTVTALLGNKTLTKKPAADPEAWGLHEYVEVAGAVGVIKPETVVQCRQARFFRNLIHPGKAQRLGQKCDRGTALAALAAVEFVVRDLAP
jgi:hypothetical protein